jgi:hypothetical protein
MCRLATCFLALCFTVAAQAAEVSAVDMGDGTAMILTIEGSKVLAAKLVPLVKLNSIPKPPDDPNPPAPAALTLKVRELAGKVANYPERQAHATALAELYSSVATQVIDGKLPTASVFQTLSAGTSLLLGQTGSQNWAGFRAGLSDELTAMLQGGKLSTAAQFGQALNEIAAGLK